MSRPEIESEDVASIWQNTAIALVIVIALGCWLRIATTPESRCANACGAGDVARVSATECICREGL